MLRALFGKTMSREEVERDVTETIESLARSSDRPPPPGWTLAGGLATDESASPSPLVPEGDEGAPVGGPAAAAAARPAPTPPTARPARLRSTSRKAKTKKVAAGTGG